MRSDVVVQRRAALAAAAALLSGCFVLDELDAGREVMNQNAPRESAPAVDRPETAKSGEAEDPQAARRAWWSGARSLGTPPPEAGTTDDPDAVVGCELRGSTRFMRRGDCLSQGGRPSAR